MNNTTDWYDITRVSATTTQITETDNVRMFLVEGTEKAMLVDAGRGVGDLRALVESLTTLPIEMFITHWHWDHIGSAAAFDPVYISERERANDGRITIDAVTDEFVDSPRSFVTDWLDDGNEFPDSFDPDSFDILPVPASAVTPITPGTDLSLGDRSLTVLHLPGHTPGHFGLLDRENGILYGGDIIHMDRGLYLHFETGDVRACLESFELLTELHDDNAFDTLVTGHNDPITAEELSIVKSFRDGLREIRDDTREYTVVSTGYGDARQYEIEGSTVLTHHPPETE